MRQRGFTLVEVMVVLVIVGLLLSMVNLNFSDRAAQQETEQFAQKLDVAFNRYREEAVFQNLDLGVAWVPGEFNLVGFYDLRLKSVAEGLTEAELVAVLRAYARLAESQARPREGSSEEAVGRGHPGRCRAPAWVDAAPASWGVPDLRSLNPEWFYRRHKGMCLDWGQIDR